VEFDHEVAAPGGTQQIPQWLAQPRRAVEADAETTAVGDLMLKGFTRPVPAFAAVSIKTPASARS